MRNDANILERIITGFSSLSPNARRIAEYIQKHPNALLTMSMAEMAAATDTSKATVSRFFKQLGYDSHQQVRKSLIALRDSGFPVSNMSGSKHSHLEIEIENLKQSLQQVSPQKCQQIGHAIANANRVFIIGYRNSYPMALHFRQQLMQIRANVTLLPQPGQSIGEDLVDLHENDVVILIGFRRRPSDFEKLIASIEKHHTVLITDPSGQIFNTQVEHCLICHIGGQAAFDSYSAPMSLIALLCNQVYLALSSNASHRTASISTWYANNNEISKI